MRGKEGRGGGRRRGRREGMMNFDSIKLFYESETCKSQFLDSHS